MRRLSTGLLALLLTGVPAAASATTIFTVVSGTLAELTDGVLTQEGLSGSLSTDWSSFLGLDLTGLDTSTTITTPSPLMADLASGQIRIGPNQTAEMRLGGVTRIDPDPIIGGGCRQSDMKCTFTLDAGQSTFFINNLLITTSVPIPEPSSVLLFGVGTLVVGRSLRRQHSI